MTHAREVERAAALWPQLGDLVPPELPPEIAVSRLVALARSLMIENRQLRKVLALTHEHQNGGRRNAEAA